MVEYLESSIMTDYDKLVQLGNEYNEDAKSIRELMNGFKQQTENLQSAMAYVDGAIGKIAGTVEESMERTMNVTKIAEKMDYSMQQMDTRTKENNKGIELMDEVISQYKLD